MISGFSFSLPYYSYGILLLCAYFAAIWIFHKNRQKFLTSDLSLIDVSLVSVTGAVFGARLFYIFLFPDQFDSFSDYLALQEGGLVFYGGFLTAAVSLLIYCRALEIPAAEFFDLLSPSIATAHAIGRIGCLINGCCYGSATQTIRIYKLRSDPSGFFRHPTQLYEMFFLLLLAAVLQKLIFQVYAKGKSFKGLIGGIYLISYSFFRFLVEFIRGDNRGSISGLTVLSPSQLVAIMLFVAGVGWISYYGRKNLSGKTNEKS